MNRSVYLIGLTGLFFAIISCGLAPNSKKYSDREQRSSYDTIRFKSSATADKKSSCYPFLTGFYERFGVMISNYYVVRDSLPIDLNNDHLVDTVVVFSPMQLEPVESSCDFKFDSDPKRLLVEIINENGHSRVRGIYSNLVSDIGGVLSHYNGLAKTKNGFKVVHEAGARYSWLYSVELAVKHGKLTLVKISKTCSYDDKAKSVSYSYMNQPLSKINIPDTLNHQCNCDPLWSILDKQ